MSQTAARLDDSSVAMEGDREDQAVRSIRHASGARVLEGASHTWLGDEIPFEKLEGVEGAAYGVAPEVPLKYVRASAQLLHRSTGEGRLCAAASSRSDMP